MLISCNSNEVVYETYSSKNLNIEQISPNIFKHTSYLNIPNYGNFPCNGIVVINEDEAIVFDTPTSDSVSAELIHWIVEIKKKHVKAVVVNHFHVDCLGGLKEFHKQKIKSYASRKTIELAKKSNTALPQNAFEQELELSVGDISCLTQYFGPGHTEDNVVTYIPSDNALFGGCLIKEIGAGKGNLEDANTMQWPNTVNKIKVKYPNLEYVIPGHGNVGDTGLLDYTIEMFKSE